MIKTKSRLFNISSNNTSLNGSFKSKLLLQLPDLTFHNEIIETIYISIQHAEIPASWYNINYTNSYIIINNITYQIPVGNYNANNLITALNVLFPTYTITYSSITNRYTFSNSTVGVQFCSVLAGCAKTIVLAKNSPVVRVSKVFMFF